MGDTFDVLDGATANTSDQTSISTGATTGASGSGAGADFSAFLQGIFQTAGTYANRLSNSPQSFPGGRVPNTTFPVQSSSLLGSGSIVLVIILAVILWAVLDKRR